ncbi:OmpA family protein [Methylomonas sp. MED-D]|uniref:OmpA family protein n=1 Tax=unclassified Methylomonas TaxID=2608980 RepID=UPI0028A2E3DE|nr:OmpA family protein [Methylomonas sp. MV1]MDT4330350.1 OmpA family protein [Methylomonas sp. MV1]
MNNNASWLGLTVIAGLLATEVWAEDKNFGKATPNPNEIIEHFKEPAAQPAPADADDYQDVPESELENVRGLKKISNIDKATGRKVQLPTTVAEKAISMEILFDYNSATLNAQAKTQLEPVGKALASGELEGIKYRIEGHTDVVGGDQFNIELSRRRAEAVKAYLIDKFGVAGNAIQIEGRGRQELADAKNPTAEANRRVRIVSLGKQ